MSSAAPMDAQAALNFSIEQGKQDAQRVVEELTGPELEGVDLSPGILIAEGDSWFDYPRSDILDVLRDDHHWQVWSVAHMGDDLEDMAYSSEQIAALVRILRQVHDLGRTPRAILLSGGGNDVAGPEFKGLLEHAASPHPGVNRIILDQTINGRLRNAYGRLIGAVTQVCEQLFGRAIPIVVHGYAYPVPDGRGFLGGWFLLPGPWLEPAFVRKGFGDLAVTTGMMKEIIDVFNDMVGGLPGQISPAGLVHYVDLRPELSNDPSDYRDSWANEMHPTQNGFGQVAQRFHDVLVTLPAD